LNAYVNGTNYLLVLAYVEISQSVPLIARTCASTDREGAVTTARQETRRSDPGRTIPRRGMRPKQSNCLGVMCVGSGIGNGAHGNVGEGIHKQPPNVNIKT
jgi:hypothetical protein